MDLPEWYDENRTIAEMAAISGKEKSTIRQYCLCNKLKYKHIRGIIPEWYDSELTIAEMSNKTGKSIPAISNFLGRHNLKCKSAKLNGIPSWYNENMTIKEMANLANITTNAITAYLSAHGLPYKKHVVSKRKGSRHKYSFEEFMKVYDKARTVREMSMLSNIPMKNIRHYLHTYKLEYRKIIRKLEIGEWYNPSLTLSEMSFRSGIAKDDLKSLLYRKQLPYIKANIPKNAVL